LSATLTIRDFTPRDQIVTRRLVLAGLGDHFGTIDETMNPDLDDIATHYLAPGHRFVLAERDGALVGAGALIEEAPDTGRLVRMSVDRAHRSQGIGRALVNHLLAEARTRGYRRVVIETNDDWRDAIGLYRACGFTEFDRRDGEIHMALELISTEPKEGRYMGPGMLDLARHNAWATAQLLASCRGLDEPTLNATVPGTYGTIIETLRHTVASESSYVYRLTGFQPGLLWREDRAVGLDALAERASALGIALEHFLATDWDENRPGEARGDEGEVFAVAAAIFLTQAIHHANEHRAHVCTILGTLGYEPPDVSAWAYALATGRMTPKTPTSAS
jgi:GNAT superfamily N-acetyltransferase/uncharacterized damage-inducible protein DinB